MIATNKYYRLYDWRARDMRIDEATVLEQQYEEPTSVPMYYPDAIWVEYDVDEEILINPRYMWEVK